MKTYDENGKLIIIYEQTCKKCGKNFQALSPNKKFCSEECKTVISKTKICKKCGGVVDRDGRICSNCYESSLKSPHKMVVCPECKQSFKQKNSNHIYCSYECKYKHQFKSLAVHEERKCKFCGKIFVSSMDSQVFCSRMCEKTDYNRRHGTNPEIMRRGNTTSNDTGYINRIRTKSSVLEYIGGWENDSAYFICKDCGNLFKHSTGFTRPSANRKCFCPKCKQTLLDIKKKAKEEERRNKKIIRKEKKRKSQEQKIQATFKKCCTCNSLFYSPNAKTKYCSKKCATAKQWKVKDLYRYTVPLDKLYDRDRGICHICGGKCDWDDKYVNENGYIVYGNYYPSRDHIIEKCRGGEHTWENIKLAHRICNSERWMKYDTKEKRRIKKKIC